MTEDLEDFMSQLHCLKCGADAFNLVIDQNYKNRIFFLRCLRCNFVFCWYYEDLTKDEINFLKKAGYKLIPFKRLDFKHEEESSYIA